jgi:DNA-binding phage protein
MGARNPPMADTRKYAIRMAKRKIVSHQARMVREALVQNFAEQVRHAYPGVATSTAYVQIRRATGVSLSTLQRIESGNTSPQLDTLADIAHHLGTSVQALVTPRQSNLTPISKYRRAT